MRYNFFLRVFIALHMIPVKWSCASEVRDRDVSYRTLQDTVQSDEDRCVHICENVDEQVSVTVQLIKVEDENDGFFDSIINRLNGSFNSDGILGRFMNTLFNNLRRNKPKYEISTKTFRLAFSNYSKKAKSLAALIRSESTTYTAASDTPESITSMFEVSAQNMESMAAVLDPIVDKMNEYDTMDVATVRCLIFPLLAHVRDEALPNIEWMANLVNSESGHVDVEEMYDSYMTARSAPSDTWTEYNLRVDHSNSCVETTNTNNKTAKTSVMVSTNLVSTRISLIPTLQQAIASITSFKISLVSNILIFVFVAIYQIISLFTPEDESCEIGCGVDEFFIFIIIIAGIALIFATLLGSIIPTVSNPEIPDEPTSAFTSQLLIVLETPMERFVDKLLRINAKGSTEENDVAFDLDCNARIISCQNDALTAVLPF